MRRIVLDTNCLIAILPSKSPYHQIWIDFLAERLEICVSTEILLEYEEIITQIISRDFADIVIKTLLNKRNLIRITPMWRFNLIASDPDDNKFVDCAIVANATFIVSNDKHFNSLKDCDFPKIDVKRIEEFSKMLHSTSSF